MVVRSIGAALNFGNIKIMAGIKKAFVIGANGQDGSFLVRHLLNRGDYQVIGIDKNENSRWKIDSPLFHYFEIDLRETHRLNHLLLDLNPEFIFHFAAVHRSSGGSYEPIFDDVLRVNVGSLHPILEYMRRNQDACCVYASSKLAFGEPTPAIVNEGTPKKNQCLYSISKNTASHLIDYYRNHYGLKASVVYLFNHESEIRPAQFFIPLILRGLLSVIKDKNYSIEVNTLNFYCDWGSAEEFMDIVIEILEKAPGEDFVLASGVCTYAKNLVEALFKGYNLDYRKHFKERYGNQHDKLFQEPFKVEMSKLYEKVGRVPNVKIEKLCEKILNNYQNGKPSFTW